MKIPYRIERIETKQFATFQDKLNFDKDLGISTEFNFSLSDDCSQIRCISIIRYEQENDTILILELACYFVIAEEGVNQITEQGKIDVDFLRYMATITFGTARGVIHAQTQSSKLSMFVLPPINLIPIITDDMTISSPKD